MSNWIRLDKALSNMGIASRKEIKMAVRKGQVFLNQQLVKQADIKITELDTITYQGVLLQYQEYEYYMLNKPSGYVSATTDKRERTVMELISSKRPDLFPVGRLDKDTVGLLLVTNDGALAHRLLSPTTHVDKTYYVKVTGKIADDAVERFAEGILIGESELCLPATLEIIENAEISSARLTIQEGKFHQVKRMFHQIGSEVIYLKRISMGAVSLDETLAEGECRPLTKDEIECLQSSDKAIQYKTQNKSS